MRSQFLTSWRKRSNKRRVQQKRCRFFESLEPRIVLNAAPIANDDPWYVTSVDTALVVTTSDTTLLDNDWDPEGDSLTASIVDSPSNGSISGFSGSDGTFTYTPDTSYVGFDSFTYKVNDGADDSDIVTVSVAVHGMIIPFVAGLGLACC